MTDLMTLAILGMAFLALFGLIGLADLARR
jgi:hypothetical protein